MLTPTQTIIKLANQCVACGFCLPHCPTFQQTGQEARSPRGRIALMAAFAEEKLPLSEKLIQHLDSCLHCHACQAMCPAEVNYAQLIDTAQAEIYAKRKPDLALSQRFLQFCLLHPRLLTVCYRLLRLLNPVKRLLPKGNKKKLNALTSIFSLLKSLLPVKKLMKLQSYYAPLTKELGSVSIFSGCITRVFDQETLLASIQLLRVCGFAVTLPNTQCCGALFSHNGNTSLANKLALHNRQVHANLPTQTIITMVTGCQSTLKQTFAEPYHSQQVIDILQFLLSHPTLLPHFKTTSQTILLHTPCSAKNTLGLTDIAMKFLTHIPGLNIIRLQSPYCCGAAGDYFIRHAEMSRKLLLPLLNEISTYPEATALITTNIGCGLHLQQGLEAFGLSLKIMHPVTFAVQQIN